MTICYVPSGKHETFPPGHRLYWHAKGYRTTMAALDALVSSNRVRLEVARFHQVTHAESMAMKRRAHIVIDECATGSYHRSSLEGLAVGAVVVNGVGHLAGVADLLAQCAGGAATNPFVSAGLGDLHAVLAGLVAKGPRALAADGRINRAWMEAHWDFGQQWRQFWLPAIDRALDRADGHPLRAAPCPQIPSKAHFRQPRFRHRPNAERPT